MTHTEGQSSPPLGVAYRDVVDRLRGAGIETAELDARLLLSAATGVGDVALISRPEMAVDDAAYLKLEKLVARRVAGEPVSRLLGTREFWGLSFALNADTLDPRSDSETLIEAVLSHFDDRSAELHFLDLGTGTGCLLLALLSEFSHARGLGVDCAEGAVAGAENNAIDLALEDRAQFQKGNWGDAIEGRFDVIVSNPPYIPSSDIAALSIEVREHDPRLALDGGLDGLDAYRILALDTARLLVAGGFGFWEFGIGQGPDVSGIAEDAGLEVVEMAKDLGGVSRVLIVKHIFLGSKKTVGKQPYRG